MLAFEISATIIAVIAAIIAIAVRRREEANLPKDLFSAGGLRQKRRYG